METTKHTSGPWKLNESDLIIENSNGYAIARIIGDSNKQINVYDGKLIASAPELLAERDKLQKFKEYVHKRLDDAGVSTDPESLHKAAGCRIGGRLDELIAERDKLKEENERLRNQIMKLNQAWDCDKAALKEGWQNSEKYEKQSDRLKEVNKELLEALESINNKSEYGDSNFHSRSRNR